MISYKEKRRLNKTYVQVLAWIYHPDNGLVIHNGIITDIKKEPFGRPSDQAHNK